VCSSDLYLANGAEPWCLPSIDSLPKFNVQHPDGSQAEKFLPYEHNEELSRHWALPGTPGLQHRIGGLEKSDGSGDVCYDPENHEHMIRLRRRKIDGIANSIPEIELLGEESGKLLVLGWGSTYGAITSAVEQCHAKGIKVSSAHLRYIDPMPKNLGDILKRFDRVLVPEMNLGQLKMLIRANYLVDAVGLNKVIGKPFKVIEIQAKIEEILANGKES